ncbi:MAG: flagellar hook-basal body complex protein [Planctomycetes bacterium]|nr:flagellar hook-basal body complex protein [Planctomycetota bacterium]MBI3843041.1 flagellar hook-basal body complex protein [Planctomycetota bacterium]
MFSALTTGLSGLQAHQFLLDVVGNNLANASTTGYQSNRVTFADLLSQMTRPPSSPGASIGGVNPIQVGRGVRTASVDLDTAQGSLQTTGRTFDLAIQGNGMFELTDGSQNFFTRVGTFGLDGSSTLVDTRSGLKVKSASGGAIKVNLNQVIAAQATQNLTLGGSLPAVITGPVAEVLSTSGAFKTGTAASVLGSNSEPFVLTDGMTLTVRVDGGAAQTVTFNTADFANIGAATAAEVAAKIQSTLGAGVSATAVGGAVQVDSTSLGSGSAIQITGGTAQSLLGLSSTPAVGTESAATGATALNSLLDNTTDYVDGDTITLSGTDADGTAVSATFTYGAANNGTTLGELVTFIDNAFGGSTASLDADGNLVVTADTAGQADMSLSLEDGTSNTGNIDFTTTRFAVTTDGKDKDTHTTSIDIFDSQGRAHTLTLKFLRDQANEWTLNASVDPSEGSVVDGTVSGILFNEDGSFARIAGIGNGDGNLEVQWNGIATPQTIDVDFGASGTFDGLTQLGQSSTAIVRQQDGFEGGSLSTISVSREGVIEGFFTNGQTLALDQLRLNLFANPAGLLRVGDTLFQSSPNSGSAIPALPLQGGAGAVVSGALEGSNVDVAREFVNLIVAQRGFQVNARSITTADQVLQELVNLVR